MSTKRQSSPQSSLTRNATRTGISAYLVKSAHPLTALVLVLPLLVLYNAGVAAQGWSALNGADVITATLLRWAGRSGWIGFQIALLAVFTISIAYLRRRGAFQGRFLIPLLAESLLYGLTMGSVILALMEQAHLLGADPRSGFGAVLVVSAGAGVHEELLFRQAMIPALRAAFQRGAELAPTPAIALAAVISSILFSLAHYIGPEPFAMFSFVYRTLAGLIFALLFLFRGLAVAVYTHFFYDVYVMSLG